MNKLKAFTLLELIIVMVLMALVTGIAFQAYQIVSSQYHSYQQNVYRDNELMLFENTLQRDFSSSAYVKKTETGIQCIRPDKTVEYTFAGDYVLRTIDIPDTFHIHAAHDSTSFYAKGNLSQGDFVQKLGFTVNVKEELLPYLFVKEYGADVLMKLKLNQQNNGNRNQ
jgi:prepilin-type N-terminal cleavage/methylation domain-containing protein